MRLTLTIIAIVVLATGLIVAKLAGPTALTIHGESAVVIFKAPPVLPSFLPTCTEAECGNQLALLCMDDGLGPDMCASAVFSSGSMCTCTCYGGEIVVSACQPTGVIEGPDGFPFGALR